MRIQLHHFFISEGHNFKGRFGQEPLQNPILEPETIECVMGRGIRGDRYYHLKEHHKGQVTFFEWETFSKLCNHFELDHLTPSNMRRNIITEGVELNQLIGVQFKIGDVQFEGTEECRPCFWMDQAVHEGAFEWMKGRGGLRAKVLTNGSLTLGQHDLLKV